MMNHCLHRMNMKSTPSRCMYDFSGISRSRLELACEDERIEASTISQRVAWCSAEGCAGFAWC